ncbi:MAG: hypothetical protein NVS4B3_00430 [Gemmatimonadaceae bacterium]
MLRESLTLARFQPSIATAHTSVRAGDVAALSAELNTLLRKIGIHAALGFLNARTRFRFTGISERNPSQLQNVRHYDRENPTLNMSGGLRPTDGAFEQVTCGSDTPGGPSRRLRLRYAGEGMLSCVAVPIRLPNGRTWGTLCHCDLRPRLIMPEELAVLDAIMPIFAAWARHYGGTS